MDVERFRRLRGLFEQAQERTEEQRGAYLDRACGDDAELRAELERMLAASCQPAYLEPPRELEPPPAAPPGAGAVEAGAAAGRVVGGYRIVRVLGAGGMGVVYEARQETPQRRVALKTLRTGPWSESMARRLRYEADVLARLQHPGIAQIYEAGVHADPQDGEVPFFAMEYVEGGVDLIRYARRRALGTRAAVELFLEVCDAVAHGHQHGVIHRDLKAANVLVGAQGHPKVIDFGVARAVGGADDAGTRLTREGELVGTLFSMAPEQFSGDPDRVDTRTDVYALGLLLYELLYERSPYALAGRSLTDVARVVREVPAVDPRGLRTGLPEELGWIALRALEKDPDRRYPSASALAADLRRFLANLPVEAGPPSALYRLRKLVRRHRVGVAAAALVAAAIAGGGLVALAALVQARTDADRFRAINEVLTQMFTGVREERQGPNVRAAELLARAERGLAEDLADRPEVEAPLRRVLARSFLSLSRPRDAERQARRALELYVALASPSDDERLESAYLLGMSLLKLGQPEQARAVTDRHLDAARAARAGPDRTACLALLHLDGLLLCRAGRFAQAEAALRPALERSLEALGAEHKNTMDLELALVEALTAEGRLEEAEQRARSVVARHEARYGHTATWTHDSRHVLARVLMRCEAWDEARALLEGVLGALIQTHGEADSRTLLARNDLGALYLQTGRALEARRLLGETAAARTATSGPAHPETATVRGNLAAAAGAADRTRAERELRAAAEAAHSARGEDHPETLAAVQALGSHLRRAGRFDEAEALLRDNLARRRRVLGEPHVEVCESLEELGALLLVKRQGEEALALLTESWRALDGLLGPEDRRTLRAGFQRGTALMVSGRHEQAFEVQVEALARLRALDPEDPELCTAMLNVAQLHLARGERDAHEALVREAAAHALEHVPAEDPMRTEACLQLGELLDQRGRSEEALPWFERAVEAAEGADRLAPGRRARCTRGLGRCLRALGLAEEALHELSAAYELERARLGAESAELEPAAREIAALLDELGRREAAAEWRARPDALRSRR